MNVLERKGRGYAIRPPLIGFIQNHWLRRLCMIMVTPVMLSLTLFLDCVRAIFWVLACFVNNVRYIPASYKKPGQDKAPVNEKNLGQVRNAGKHKH
jgi:hypothetical protein